MLPIVEPRISEENGRFVASCVCGKRVSFAAKHGALKMLQRGVCRNCRPDYRSVKDDDYSIYKNASGKWCSVCSGCEKEQAYTRKDHAKQSSLNDWQCRSCYGKAKSDNGVVGDERREYNRYKKSAADRGIQWDLTLEQMFSSFTGRCAMTKWPISISYMDKTASLDRIDSAKGYTKDNVWWVHSMVNMSKNKYSYSDFITMCIDVAKHAPL